LQTASWCGDESPFSALQFIPDTQSLIYQSACAQPPADIYAVNPDGSDLRQLTNTTPGDETQPSLSPDGSSVVYVHQDVPRDARAAHRRCGASQRTAARRSS
jgi:Tol biopolymer transport system component